MLKLSRNYLSREFMRTCLLLLASLLLFSPEFGYTMGMDFGGFGGGTTVDERACTPDSPLVILPGPIGSPVRIVGIDVNASLLPIIRRKPSIKSIRRQRPPSSLRPRASQ